MVTNAVTTKKDKFMKIFFSLKNVREIYVKKNFCVLSEKEMFITQ